MAGPIYIDRVKDTSATTGTGTLTLAGSPPTGSQSFAAVGNGNTCYYMASTSNQAQVEVGLGTYSSTGPTLARNTVAYSTNSNAKVDFSAAITVELVAAAAFFTAAQAANAVMVGDTGSGGTAGIVPSPAAGDAAANKFLNANGTWKLMETPGTPVHYLSAASTNQTNVKASAGVLMNITAINTTATVYYLKLHNTASTPTAGTTAVVQCYAIPASVSGNGLTISVPMTFTSGIAFTLVGGIADNDTANAATGVTIDFVYR